MKKLLKNIFRATVIFLVSAFIYCSCEYIFRQYTHWSMFILSGICGVCFIDAINNVCSFEMGYLNQIAISTILCTIAEGICGLIVNIWLGLNVWDYSTLPGTFFYNQCNIFFVGIWALIIAAGILICDFINYYWFKIEPCPYYKINGKIVFKFKRRKIK